MTEKEYTTLSDRNIARAVLSIATDHYDYPEEFKAIIQACLDIIGKAEKELDVSG